MPLTPTTAGPTPDESSFHFREQAEDDGAVRNDATLSFEGRMKVSSDEESGGDPYNRTGRFQRLVR